MKVSIVFDFDGVLFPLPTTLERLAFDYLAENPDLTEDLLKTAEELGNLEKQLKESEPQNYEKGILNAYENEFLKKYEIAEDFIKERAQKYGGEIPDYVKRGISSLGDYELIIINTGTPKQMMDIMLEEAGIHDKFSEIYANEFLIENGKVIGFNKNKFFADGEGKLVKYNEIPGKKIIVGDSYPDISIINHPETGIYLTFEHAPEELKNAVKKRFDKSCIYKNPEELFTNIDERIKKVTELFK